jgi:hypothetical protein
LRQNRSYPLLAAALAMCHGACSTRPSDTGSETASESDADVDADADADVPLTEAGDDVWRYERYGFDVVGTGTFESGGEKLDGSIEFLTDLDGLPICDATILYSGTPYTGTCDDCAWGYSVVGTDVRNDGTPECYLFPPLTFIPDSRYPDLYLAFAPERITEGYLGSYTAYDVLEVGSSGLSSPFEVSYEGSTTGTFSEKGDDIAWTFLGYELHYDMGNAFYADCGSLAESEANRAYGGEGQSSTIDCEGFLTDVWSFEATPGETIQITVDTVTADTAFDPWFYLNDPLGCTILLADDNFRCTFEPLAYRCPSGTFEALTAGTYEIEVHSMGACTGKTAAYSLGVTSMG